MFVLAVKPTLSPRCGGGKRGKLQASPMDEEKQQAGKSLFAAPPLFVPHSVFRLSKSRTTLSLVENLPSVNIPLPLRPVTPTSHPRTIFLSPESY